MPNLCTKWKIMENKHLDILVIRNNNTLKTTVYRKNTHNGVYLHWNYFMPSTWKHATLHSLITRSYTICSTEEDLQAELLKIKPEFTKTGGYPRRVFEKNQ